MVKTPAAWDSPRGQSAARHAAPVEKGRIPSVDGRNVYLNLNPAARPPIAQTQDAAANLRAQDRMRELSARSLVVVPGHAPEVFSRFSAVAEGVVEIAGRR